MGRPSILATLLWAFGILIIALTVYSIISLRGWTENLHDVLLVFVAFSSGVNAIVTGALIDMHTMRYESKNLRISCARITKHGRKVHRKPLILIDPFLPQIPLLRPSPTNLHQANTQNFPTNPKFKKSTQQQTAKAQTQSTLKLMRAHNR